MPPRATPAAFPAATSSRRGRSWDPTGSSGTGYWATDPGLGVGGHRALGLEGGSEGLHRGRPDPVHLVELVHGGKTAVLVAVLDDLLRRHGADPLDLVQLLDGRAAEADRTGLPRGRGGGCRSAPTPRDHNLLAVAEAGGEIDRVLVCASDEAAGPPHGVGHPRPGRQAIDAGPSHGTGHVHDHILRPARLVGRVRCEADLRSVPRARAARADPAGPDDDDRRCDHPVDQHLRAARVRHAVTLAAGSPRNPPPLCRIRYRAALDQRTSNPDSPAGSSSTTSTDSTTARLGPVRLNATSCSTAAASPSKTASTAPSGRLVTQPVTPAASALRRVESRKKTPWTRPRTTTRLRVRD